jgi:hypothetical protein
MRAVRSTRCNSRHQRGMDTIHTSHAAAATVPFAGLPCSAEAPRAWVMRLPAVHEKDTHPISPGQSPPWWRPVRSPQETWQWGASAPPRQMLHLLSEAVAKLTLQGVTADYV